MATIMQARVRPAANADPRAKSKPRSVGLAIAAVGLAATAITLIANLTAAADTSLRAGTLPWSFGLTTLGFGTVKLAIGIVLWGILMKLWHRVDAIRDVLPRLVDVDPNATIVTGDVKTAHGAATASETAPADLPIHKMAKKMWLPMLGMGIMAVVVGFVVSLAWAANGSVASAAWTQGIQFLGEALLLSGIAFLLGTILWAIRTGGGDVQQTLGVAVTTLKMPMAAKGFVALMMTGLMVGIAQLVGYIIVAGGGVDTAAWMAFLGPAREFSLALILAGITLALATIGKALDFQFARIVELIRTGR